ncbi:MAG: DUF4405 domain-containing protein [Acidobacteriota bacterium]
MKKPDWKYLVDTLLFGAAAGMAVSGIILEKGHGGGAASAFLGLGRGKWAQLHAHLAVAFVVLAIFHLVLSWDWIKCMAKKIFKKAWPAGIALTAVLALLIVYLIGALGSKSPAGPGNHGQNRGTQAGQVQPAERPQ